MLRLNARDMLGNSKTLGRQYFNELMLMINPTTISLQM